ncbi:DarT ssDNA thymidine ADP-ribosyltransferase family protein [Rhizobium leguminosarum]|uniref:DarT ssDNA thymidine ADP-ribosyltransferase family protein n=1 Tax=Rhizobium leguminosarum TaxID=384 RepID=UPI003F94AB76
MVKISEYAGGRGITEIVHFTTNLGLTGCLHKVSLLSRFRLRTEESLAYILTLNSSFRKEEEPWFDQSEKWIDFVNLSVSEITTNLFRASLKWHSGKDLYWVIMAFDPAVLDGEGVYFSTTNNIYQYTSRQTDLDGFKKLFEPIVKRRPGWTAFRNSRPEHLTTCEQAEVLYPRQVDMLHLRRVYVMEGDLADRVTAVLASFGRDDVEVVVDPAKFTGQPN